jgi:hypothetical protein
MPPDALSECLVHSVTFIGPHPWDGWLHVVAGSSFVADTTGLASIPSDQVVFTFRSLPQSCQHVCRRVVRRQPYLVWKNEGRGVYCNRVILERILSNG